MDTILLFSVLLMLLFNCVWSSEAPIEIPCQFQSPGGWFYDISALRKAGDYSSGIYKFNICQNAGCGSGFPSVACERVDGEEYWSLGTIDTSELLPHFDGPGMGVMIRSWNGTITGSCPFGLQSNIIVTCNSRVDAVVTTVKDLVCLKEFYVESQLGCPKGRLMNWQQIQGMQYTILSISATVIALLVGIVVMSFLLLKKSYIPLPQEEELPKHK